MRVCKRKQAPNFHQILEPHPKLFPFKNNLKIKVMKWFNPIQPISHLYLALLNHCHSPSNKPYLPKNDNITQIICT